MPTNENIVQTQARTTLETLLEEYKPIYDKYVYEKIKSNVVYNGIFNNGAPITIFYILFGMAGFALHQIMPISPYVIGIFCTAAAINFIIMLGLLDAITYRERNVKSPEQIRKLFDDTPLCEVETCGVMYETVAQRNRDIVSIRLLAEDQPSFLVSLRGPHGPITKHDLVQYFTLIDEDAKQPAGPYPGITNQQCQDFPKKLNLAHLNIHMFPNIFTSTHKEHSPWHFMIPNTDACEEIKEAFELLCGTIQQSIIIDELKLAVKNNRPIPGDYKAAYFEGKIITYLQGNPSGTNADTINDLIDKIEAVVTDENVLPSAKANAIEMHSADTSGEV